jgi:hypothetical protein
MRLTPKFSVCLAAISVGLLFVLCNSAWPQETEKANARIKELQQQRLAVLEKICDRAKKLFTNARIEYEEVHAANRELFAARLAYADTRKDRIKVCDDAVQDALDWQKLAQQMAKQSRASALFELKSEAYLLETRIAREKAAAEK